MTSDMEEGERFLMEFPLKISLVFLFSLHPPVICAVSEDVRHVGILRHDDEGLSHEIIVDLFPRTVLEAGEVNQFCVIDGYDTFQGSRFAVGTVCPKW